MSVSVIIPTLNEEGCVAQTLRLLRQQGPREIIVVDGGSNDATCRMAAGADILLHSLRGRALQMNLGAAHACGEVLLFLHADCSLQPGALAEAQRCLRLHGVYGDQGLFVRRNVFEHLGGFPRLFLMEDLFFSRRLRRHGRVVVAPRRIFVSPRRWQRAGLVRQTLRNWGLTTLAACGVDPNRLARFYPAVR
jgi:glycosyltransferase involved in cell wall biosynthesis